MIRIQIREEIQHVVVFIIVTRRSCIKRDRRIIRFSVRTPRAQERHLPHRHPRASSRSTDLISTAEREIDR